MIRSENNMHYMICDLCHTESSGGAEIISFNEHNANEGGWLLWYERHICPKCTLEAVEMWLRFRKPI
jgi:hypothetical protein